MKEIIHNEWQEKLKKEFEAPYYQQLRAFLKQEYLNETVYPGMQHIWGSLRTDPLTTRSKWSYSDKILITARIKRMD